MREGREERGEKKEERRKRREERGERRGEVGEGREEMGEKRGERGEMRGERGKTSFNVSTCDLFAFPSSGEKLNSFSLLPPLSIPLRSLKNRHLCQRVIH